MQALSDEQILERYRQAQSATERGDLVGELFQRHYQRVALWCLRWCANKEDAADLAQEVFAKVYRNLHTFEGSSKFSTWLFIVCRHHCLNAAESRRLRVTSALDDALAATLRSPEPSVERRLEQQSQVAAARQLLEETLNEMERKVVLLHYCDEMPLEMVTRRLGLTNSSGAKAYMVSARRKLKSALTRWKAKHGTGVLGGSHESV
ncbi:MAG: RNA polymerase sigma factor [Bryobacterales bacterium]|nr:RNA polymerase sigma factor [Bryobacterales bacterium]